MSEQPKSTAERITDTKEEGVGEMARSERSYKAAAHNPTNSPEARLHAAQELDRLQKERTGHGVDVEKEAQVGGPSHD